MTTRAPKRPTFHRFSELTRTNVNRDFQVHTNWTDGQGTIAEVLDRAREVGLAELAFTEHARASSDYYRDFFREIDEREELLPELAVYRGFEVKVLDESGTLDLTDEMREMSDIVLGSVHSFARPGGRFVAAADLGDAEACEIEFGLARAIIEGGRADVLSHAGGMCLRTFGHFPVEYLDQLIALAADRAVAFEINNSYHAGILKDLVPLLTRHDPPISIGSDAHRLDEIGICRDMVREVLGL